MKVSVRKITNTAFAYLMICSLGLLLANQLVFMHTHKIDGKVIVHAHPYNKSNDTAPFKTHQHSKTQLYFLENLDLLFPVFFMALTASVFFRKLRRYLPTSINYYSACYYRYSGRAPPSCFDASPLVV